MIPDTLMGYPVVTIDNMPMDAVGMIEFGPPLWVDVPMPTRLTVYDFQGNILGQANLKWRDCGLTWRAKVEWGELPEEEEE